MGELEHSNVIIVGSGRLGGLLARSLSSTNNDVTVIDQNESAFQLIGDNFGGVTIIGDATTQDTLLRAGIEKADVVLVATNNDNVNVYVSLIAKEIYGVENVIARLYDESRSAAYDKLDIKVVCPSILSQEQLRLCLNDYRGPQK